MNTRWIVLTLGAIGLNLLLGKAAQLFGLPVYLDSAGTILSVALLPWYLSITIALATSAVGSLIIDPHLLAYTGTQLTIALVALLCFRAGLLDSWQESLLSGLTIAVCSVMVSAPVTVLLFNGITWANSTTLTAILMASGKSLWQSVVQGALFIEAIDKTVAALLAWILLKLLPAKVTDDVG